MSSKNRQSTTTSESKSSNKKKSSPIKEIVSDHEDVPQSKSKKSPLHASTLRTQIHVSQCRWNSC